MVHEFITSRKCQINEISVSRYDITEKYQTDHEGRLRFFNWLEKQSNTNLFMIGDGCFFTFDKMPRISGPQYRHKNSVKIQPPFQNTEKISNYLGHLLREMYKEKFERYLNTNTFIVNEIEIGPFKLQKCFSFNLEIFEDGCFYVHLVPTTKIVNSNEVTYDYLIFLLKELSDNNKKENVVITLVNTKKYFRKKISLSNEDIQGVAKLIESEKFIATFDYKFIAHYSPHIFELITKQTVKNITQSIEFLIPIANDIVFPEFVDIQPKPFLKIDYVKISSKNNLEVGQGFVTGKQSAAHYNGIYRKVESKAILPICFEKEYLSEFLAKVTELNGDGDIKFLPKIQLDNGDSLPIEQIKNIIKEETRPVLIVLFTPIKIVNDILVPLKTLKAKYQFFCGEPGTSFDSKARLSNFTIKCLEKLDGILCSIHNTQEFDTTYFIGIDLGHSTHGKEKFSNIGMVLFDNKGLILKKYVEKKVPRNEALTPETVSKCFYTLLNFLKKNGMPHPKKIIIHRDGKLHKTDIEIIVKNLSELYDIWDIDVVEIIKSGYPVLRKLETDGKGIKNYKNPESGDCWILPEKRYAILVTNTQSTEKEAILNPIVVKHKLGNTDFEIILNYIYWFTKIYTNNLYTSSRLPATTLKANNIVSTSIKQHTATHLG